MNKQLLVLGGIALLALAAGLWLQYGSLQPRSEDELLFDDLVQQAANINHISISNHDGEVFNAVREMGQWQGVLKEQEGKYPAQPSKLSALVTALMRARLIEAKTNIETNHHHLGLQSPDTKDSLASLITLSSADKRWQVLVGKHATIGKGQYIRLPDQRQSWLIDQELDLPLEQNSWLKQPILPFESGAFTRISRIDNEQWTIEKTAAGAEFLLQEMPSSRQLKYQSILDNVAANLANLKFDKLQKSQQNFWTNLQPMVSLSVSTHADKSFNISIAEREGRAYVKFTSIELQGYWLNWSYEISRLSAQQLSKTLEDFLLAPIEEDTSTAQEVKAIDEGESAK
jgi:hypothetical protein